MRDTWRKATPAAKAQSTATYINLQNLSKKQSCLAEDSCQYQLTPVNHQKQARTAKILRAAQLSLA